MKKLIFILLLLHASGLVQAQGKNKYQGFPSLVWPKLYDIQYEKAHDDNGEYEKPIFSEAAKSLAGKSVVLPGYMVPFDNGTKGTIFMLTSLPLNACFFCGVGGPESVVQVFLKSAISYTEKPIEVKGVLRLNDKNPDQMIYILDQAEFLGMIDF
ncbi:MAG: DUF3299 domain-containing protein [Cyclobacteriaceae bacterium]|nr:DUF3299 domain-containing protein [Cyclobacteriaceae bacterium]